MSHLMAALWHGMTAPAEGAEWLAGWAIRPRRLDKAAKSPLATRTKHENRSCRSSNPGNYGGCKHEFSWWVAGQLAKIFLALLASAVHLDPLTGAYFWDNAFGSAFIMVCRAPLFRFPYPYQSHTIANAYVK